MPPVFRQSSPDQADSEKCLRLRPSSVLAACFLIVAAVVLAYLGGVMSGRAYCLVQPPQTTAGRGAATRPPSGGAAAPKEAPGAEHARQEEEPRQQILAPEELRFAKMLRGENPSARLTPPTLVVVPPARLQNAPQAGAPPEGPARSGAPVAAAQGPSTPPAPAVKMYDYVFQVGAFNNEETVDALRQRLEGRGLRTRMQRSGKLYVVLVLLRGDEARAAEVARATESLGLGKPIQRSRKPAAQ